MLQLKRRVTMHLESWTILGDYWKGLTCLNQTLCSWNIY